jgi:hypothetical protein
VCGIDISAELIARASAAAGHRNLRFEVGDIREKRREAALTS